MDQRLKRKVHNLENIERVAAEEVFEYVLPQKEDDVLDLGAGTGYMSLALAKHVKKVVAFDFDADVLAYLKNSAVQLGMNNIETSVGDFKKIPFESGSFNKSVASISLHEVQPLSAALQEIHRVLTKDGLFVCIEIEKVEGVQAPRVSSEEMKAEIIKAGFVIEEMVFPEATVAGQPVYIVVGRK